MIHINPEIHGLPADSNSLRPSFNVVSCCWQCKGSRSVKPKRPCSICWNRFQHVSAYLAPKLTWSSHSQTQAPCHVCYWQTKAYGVWSCHHEWDSEHVRIVSPYTLGGESSCFGWRFPQMHFDRVFHKPFIYPFWTTTIFGNNSVLSMGNVVQLLALWISTCTGSSRSSAACNSVRFAWAWNDDDKPGESQETNISMDWRKGKRAGKPKI